MTCCCGQDILLHHLFQIVPMTSGETHFSVIKSHRKCVDMGKNPCVAKIFSEGTHNPGCIILVHFIPWWSAQNSIFCQYWPTCVMDGDFCCVIFACFQFCPAGSSLKFQAFHVVSWCVMSNHMVFSGFLPMPPDLFIHGILLVLKVPWFYFL